MTRSRAWMLVCCGVALMAIVACTSADDQPALRGPSSADTRPTETAAPARGQGVLLTVAGSVGLVFGDHAFEVGVRGADAVLVVSLERAFPTQRGMRVRVTGVVEPLRVSVLEARGLRDEAVRLAPLEGREALMATVVEPDDAES